MTSTRITIEHLGSTANIADLESFAATFLRAAESDKRIIRCDLHWSGDTLCLYIDGSINAAEFTDEIYEGKHGTW